MATYYSAYDYDHNTAHILEPVQGYDIVSFMNFWAEIDEEATPGWAQPGTVMHRNPTTGKMSPGLTKTSMAQFLYSKQDSEDVLHSPVTVNGMNVTSIGTISYGGFNTAPYQGNPAYKTVDGKRVYQEGISSNIGKVEFVNGKAQPLQLNPQQSAFTTFPGACGLELGSSEFAYFKGTTPAGDQYEYDMPLTSPLPGKESTWGTEEQQAFGGYLMPGTHYADNICGILSQKPFRNENGTRMIRFWAVYQPAITDTSLAAVNELSLSSLTDVDLTGATNGSVLKRNSEGTWVVGTDVDTDTHKTLEELGITLPENVVGVTGTVDNTDAEHPTVVWAPVAATELNG